VIPWWVRLPPLVAKDGSANLLWLIVGISGAAKCPASQIDWSLYENRLMFPDELRWRRGVRDMSNILTPHTPASGQAFSALFWQHTKPPEGGTASRPVQLYA